MGCEGNITIARIQDGHHLIDEDKDPVFKVTEPVAIIPCFVSHFGNYPIISCDEAYEKCFALEYCSDQVVGIGNDSYPEFAIGIMTKKVFDVLSKDKPSWDFVGYVSKEKTMAVWEKIVPGIWIVTNYYTTGSGDDNFSWSLNNKKFTLGQEIEWEIWT